MRFILFAAVLAFSACRSHAPDEQPSKETRAALTKPTEVPRAERVASIESEPRLVIRKSMPPGYVVSFQVQLKTTCERVEEPRVTIEETTIRIVPVVSAPAGEACEATTSTTRGAADLGTDFAPDTTFLVEVDGRTVSFTTP